MEIFIVDKRATGEIRSQILDYQKIQKLTDKARDNAVVVAGDSLIKIVKNETVKEDFLQLALAAKVVIACRVSPK
jgi:hypothetical protein